MKKRSIFSSGNKSNIKRAGQISVCPARFKLFALFVEIAATSAAFFSAGYFNRAERTVFAVVIVFAIANVAFDAVVFVLHKKDLLLKSLYIMDERRFFIRF